MISNPNSKSLIHDYSLYFITIFASIVLSIISCLHYQPFNIDGILYLQSAQAFVQNGFHAAFNTYPWPFYSILIGIISLFTSLSLENAAFFLNFILTTTIILSFILLIKELGGDRQTQIFAAIVILLFPYLNHDRDNILRDFGYYAFTLISLLMFIRFFKKPDFRIACMWGISAIIATLFRVEGFVLLALAPTALFFQTQFRFFKRILNIIKIYLLPIICLGLFLIFKPKHNHMFDSNLAGAGYFYYYLTNVKSLLFTTLNSKITFLNKTLFVNSMISADAIAPFFYSGLLGIFFSYLISAIGIGYLLLSYHAIRYHLIPTNKNTIIPWTTYLSLTFLTIIAFLLLEFFLTDRYIFMPGILLVLAAPFSLNTIYNNWRNKKACFTGKRWVFPVICIFLIFNLISSVGHFGTSKVYIRQAGNWLDKNTATNSRIFSNDPQLMYYSHRTFWTDYKILAANSDPLFVLRNVDLKKYDYFAIMFERNQLSEKEPVLKLLQTKPIVTFCNKKGDCAWIFQAQQT